MHPLFLWLLWQRFTPAVPPPSGLPDGLDPQPVSRQPNNLAVDHQVVLSEVVRIPRSDIGFDRRQLRIDLP